MHGTLVTKMLLSGLVGLLLALTADARFGNSSDLDSCSETKQCLLFDVICQTDDFEVRQYGPVTYVVTDETAKSVTAALKSAYPRLYQYFNGTNENGTKIDMPRPFFVRVPSKPISKSCVFRVNALLPAEYREYPPSPTDDRVNILHKAAFKAYVKSYHGLVTNKAERRNAFSLSEDLDSVHANYDQHFHISATYGGRLWTPADNEVLYFVQDEPVCISSEEIVNGKT